MFYSVLLSDVTRRHGQMCNVSLFKNAIKERHQEIIEMAYDLWQDSGDKIFDGYFRYFFPPGFIERDMERAKQVIRDLWNTAQSPVTRRQDAIHCYVMYHIIDAWFGDPYIQSIEKLPSEIKALVNDVKEKQKSHNKQCGQLDQAEQDNQEPPVLDQYDGDSSDSELITKWFTDKDVCLSDFEDSYDEDYVDETTAEGAAEAFLSYEGM